MLIRSALGAADKRRIQAMLFANNGGDLRQQLLDGSLVFLPLTHTAVPTRGSITPTFTRATTATGQKWDEAGYLDFTALAGEVVFKGARRERNLLTFTEDFSNAAWTKINGGAGSAPTVASGFTDPDGGTTAFRIQANAGGSAGGDYSVVRQVAAGGNQRSIYVKSNTGASQEIYFGAPAANQKVTVTTTWQQLAAPLLGGNTNYDIGSFGVVGNATIAIDILVWHPMLSDITGETDQTTIRPYVSVGVESAPAYHGSMVDGVKCYDTDRSGNPISTYGSYPLVGYVPWEARTNLALQSNSFNTAPWGENSGSAVVTQNAIGPDGATSAWTMMDDSAVSAEGRYASLILTAATYTYSVFVKKETGTPTNYPIIAAFEPGGGLTFAAVTVDTVNGLANAWTAYTGRTAAPGLTGRCTSFNSAFWRVEMSFTGTAADWGIRLLPAGSAVSTALNTVVDGTAQGSAVFYGAMVNLGAFAGPYIPTTTVAVARNADLLTYTGADVANIKTLAATFSRGVGVSSSGVIVAVCDGTANERVQTYISGATSVTFLGVDGGAIQWQTTASSSYTPGATSKATQTFAANDVKMDLDGTAQTPDTTATMPSYTQFQVGHLNGASFFNGPVNHIYGWTRNLSQSELGAIDRA